MTTSSANEGHDDPPPYSPPPPVLRTRIAKELGLHALYHSSYDTKILCVQRFVRLFAFGGSTLILALYLSEVGISDARIGLFMSLTLFGDVFISFTLTLVADGLGRRRVLALGALLMSVSGVIFGLTGNFWLLLAAAIIGVISPRYASCVYSMKLCTSL